MNDAAMPVETVTDEDLQREAEAIKQRLDAIHRGLIGKRDEWVAHRAKSGVEQRWRKCELLYNGDEVEEEDTGLKGLLKNGPKSKVRENETPRSRVKINIVRNKVDTAVARLCEILLPTDDSNWGIRRSPKPELADGVRINKPAVNIDTGEPITGPDGKQLTVSQIAKATIQRAEQAAKGMEEEIADALEECDYNGEQRKVIAKGVRYGTGVLKGPFPRVELASVWTSGAFIKTETIRPGSAEVPCWNIFPDPACGNDVKRGSGIFEVRPITKRELRRLAKLPGFIESAIRMVLEQKPKKVVVADGSLQKVEDEHSPYQMWEYHGEIDPEEMKLLSRMAKDPLNTSSGVIVAVNDIVIGALPPFNEDHPIPYDLWCWREVEDSPFGEGMPLDSESQQRVVNASWRMMMDTGRNSAGPQVVYNPEMVQPADGEDIFVPNKLWHATGDVSDVRQAFQVFSFQGGLSEMISLVNLAMEVNEREQNMPALMQGQQGAAPEQLGGQILALQQANAPLRQRVKRYDDCITRPHIGRHADWQMVNNSNDEIKGDYEIDARGSSVLMERDIQNLQAINLANIIQTPMFAKHVKERWAIETILKGYFKINPNDALKSEDEVRQIEESPQPTDPRIEAAQIAAQTKMEEIADRKEERQFRREVENQNAQERSATIQYNREREQGEFEIAMTQAQNERDIAFARLANERQMSVEQLMQMWKIKVLDIDNQRQIFNAEQSAKTNIAANI